MSKQPCRGCGTPTTSRNGYCWKNCHNQYMREFSKRDDHDEIVYVVRSERMGLHKIGHTKNLRARMVTIRSGCPDAVVMASYHHDRKLEAFLKQHLRPYRFGESEWYDLQSIGGSGAVGCLVQLYEDISRVIQPENS